jgi:hypothetical protein
MLCRRYDRVKGTCHPVRKGYPRAVREGILSIPDQYQLILTLDSDGQCDPAGYLQLLETLTQTGAQVSSGVRMTRTEQAYRIALSKALSAIVRLIFGVRLRDVTSGFKLMQLNVAKSIAEEVKYTKFNFWVEFTVRAAKSSKLAESEVNYRARRGASRVYSLRKMPLVVLNEFLGLWRTWFELRSNARGVENQ